MIDVQQWFGIIPSNVIVVGGQNQPFNEGKQNASRKSRLRRSQSERFDCVHYLDRDLHSALLAAVGH